MSRRVNIAAQHGYSMMAVMLVMLATSLLAGAAFSAVGADIPFARAAQDRKQAYAAAEAGLEYYLYQLARDNDYWTKCTDVPEISPGVKPPINQQVSDPDDRLWRNVSGNEARFSLELLPANGEPACVKARPEATMLDADSGTFRIRSTGESRGERRSIVATFRRSSFLDYIYFTDLETSDPLTYASATDRANAANQCVRYRAARAGFCTDITFVDFDRINGPLHTNDDLLTCGSPDFGRNRQDAIEISGPASDGWNPSGGSGCGGTPDFLGTLRWPAPVLAVPTSNSALRNAALAGGRVLYGRTSIQMLPSGRMNVSSFTANGSVVNETNAPLPGNGVLYVSPWTSGGTCSSLDGPLETDYADPNACAILTVNGTYTKSMTFGSDADIIVDGDILRADDEVFGLVAQNFVRVKHRDCPSTNCFERNDYRIQAAILTLAHSFIVDHYDSGERRGTLTVEGAIAQKFRGAVGQFNSSTGQGIHGYTKDYNYDNRLRYRSPPFFLDPISAAWRIIRANEQVPAPDA